MEPRFKTEIDLSAEQAEVRQKAEIRLAEWKQRRFKSPQTPSQSPPSVSEDHPPQSQT